MGSTRKIVVVTPIRQGADLVRENSTRSALLDRQEVMHRLHLKASHFSKIVNGRVKGLPLLKHDRLGRKLLFREDTLNQWIAEVESASCSADHSSR